jgi:hypothetical protein
MLETPQERIKLLKAGFTGNNIEELYVECNNFRIERNPNIVEFVEFDFSPKNKSDVPGLSSGYAQ